ncbi:MAG: hypothetical protein AMJ62_03200 [Myxococcales bacterium SG8_38]|nr:MAG: hypothetical protein AMJ62_03200 [Myxococcales bacterium SG8_38]
MVGGLPRIWIITDPDRPEGPIASIRRALDGCPAGLVGVQLRAKRASDRQLAAWGRELRELTSAAGAALTINRRPDVAQIVGADGVHLPELGLAPEVVARFWPELRLIGVSRHDRAGLQTAERRGASYGFLSPVFVVPGKGVPLGIGGFERAIAGVGMPTFALGGIGAEHVEPLISAGAFGVAVRRAIYESSDPAETLRALSTLLDKRPECGE